MVVGLNHRTAPVAIRERFWISEARRYEALAQLARAEGIEEVIVLATCNRTEFLLWANDAALAANSVLRLLSTEYGLKLCEWRHFYRLLDDAALLHIFQVTCSLDSMVIGEPQIVSQVKAAWQQAQKVGSTARFLDAVMQKALTVSKRVRNETAIGNSAVSVPYAAVELAKQTLGSLENKKVLLLGAGKMSELSARHLVEQHGKTRLFYIAGPPEAPDARERRAVFSETLAEYQGVRLLGCFEGRFAAISGQRAVRELLAAPRRDMPDAPATFSTSFLTCSRLDTSHWYALAVPPLARLPRAGGWLARRLVRRRRRPHRRTQDPSEGQGRACQRHPVRPARSLPSRRW